MPLVATPPPATHLTYRVHRVHRVGTVTPTKPSAPCTGSIATGHSCSSGWCAARRTGCGTRDTSPARGPCRASSADRRPPLARRRPRKAARAARRVRSRRTRWRRRRSARRRATPTTAMYLAHQYHLPTTTPMHSGRRPGPLRVHRGDARRDCRRDEASLPEGLARLAPRQAGRLGGGLQPRLCCV